MHSTARSLRETPMSPTILGWTWPAHGLFAEESACQFSNYPTL